MFHKTHIFVLNRTRKAVSDQGWRCKYQVTIEAIKKISIYWILDIYVLNFPNKAIDIINFVKFISVDVMRYTA